MELKVWVEGIQRIVCGVTEKTTCQDVVYALAHATGKTGRFTLIERWRNNERLLAPQEHPLKVLQKWGEYSQDVQFILQRSALDGKAQSAAPLSPPAQRTGKFLGPAGAQPLQQQQQQQQQVRKAKSAEPPAVWKPPPPNHNPAATTGGGNPSRGPGYPDASAAARLSPDSGRGSDKTGSDTSNGYNENGQARTKPATSQPSQQPQQQQPQMVNGLPPMIPRSASASQMPWSSQPQQPGYHTGGMGLPPPSAAGGYDAAYGFTKQTSLPTLRPPAYRPPPHVGRNPSPADPPPYREPPQPGMVGNRYGGRQPGGPVPSSPTGGQRYPVRPPHYSPPPTHRTPHLSRHPSKSSLMQGHGGQQRGGPYPPQNHGLPYRQQQQMHLQSGPRNHIQGTTPTDYAELVNLVSAQQTTLHSQHAEIKQCDAEVNYLENQVDLPHPANNGQQQPGPSQMEMVAPQAGSQLDMVLAEVRRLEDSAQRNDDELRQLAAERNLLADFGGHSEEDPGIRSEIHQLRQRLAGTDQELQKTNHTLRRLGDEMRSMSLEKSRQRELELVHEVDRLQMEIKNLQKTSEEAANINQQLSKEVKDVEEQISERKAEVEKLIQEMREANMESLAISPPEESKQFLDGPPKPGTVRKMMGSPRQLENAVPTSKNPHGVWV